MAPICVGRGTLVPYVGKLRDIRVCVDVRGEWIQKWGVCPYTYVWGLGVGIDPGCGSLCRVHYGDRGKREVGMCGVYGHRYSDVEGNCVCVCTHGR